MFRPTFFNYPTDSTAQEEDELNRSFMIGDAIKVFPVLESDVRHIKSYFPNDYWVDLNTFEVSA